MKHAGAVHRKFSFQVRIRGSRRDSATATATSQLLQRKKVAAAATVLRLRWLRLASLENPPAHDAAKPDN